MALTDSIDLIGRRYDRLAPVYGLIELIFGLPPRSRRRAVAALDLRRGDRVLEIGCGSGRNLKLLTAGVGSTGQVLGVDLSAGMLARAKRLVARRRWTNVTLTRQDVAQLDVAGPFDAVLFSLSYAVIPDRHAALTRAWSDLRVGGSIVIMDACLPDGVRGRMLRPVALALSKATVLGDPAVRPWEELAELSDDVRTRRLHLGTYVIAQARKPAG